MTNSSRMTAKVYIEFEFVRDSVRPDIILGIAFVPGTQEVAVFTDTHTVLRQSRHDTLLRQRNSKVRLELIKYVLVIS